MIQNPYLKKAVEKATEVCKLTVEPAGYTEYLGQVRSDKTYPFMLNILIDLNLQILEKLDSLKEIERKQKFEKELDDISKQISNLSLGKSAERPKQTPELYNFWKPRK